MESNLKFLGPRELSTILDFMAAQLSEVVWICTNDYKKQLYTSPRFEKEWGFSRDILYEHRDIWPTTLFEEDLKRITVSFQQRQIKDKHPTIAFRIRRPDGNTRYLQDTSFGICDKNGVQVAQMGMAKFLSVGEWEELEKNKFQVVAKDLPKPMPDINSLFTDNLRLNISEVAPVPAAPPKPIYFIFHSGVPIRLTTAEAKCIYFLLQSYSAKLIARDLDLSVRTVESYIENIRTKTQCRRTVELLNKIENRNQIEYWKFL